MLTKRGREKLLASWSPLVAVIAIVALGLGLAAGPVISNLHTIVGAVAGGNIQAIQLAVLGLNLGLLTTGVMFCVARSWAITDAQNKTDEKTDRLSEKFDVHYESLAKQDLETAERFGLLQATTQRLVMDAASKSSRIVEDGAVLWRSLKTSLVTFNGTLANHETEIQPMKGGKIKISANEDVLRENWLPRKTIDMKFVAFIPRRLGFGTNPAEYLFRLVHVVRVVRTLDSANSWTPSLRVYLVNAPRPVSSFFLTNKERAGKLAPYALEYFRSTEPGTVSTPTSSRMLLEHTSVDAIRGLEECIRQALTQSVEISFDELERIIGPMLPATNGGTVPQISEQAWAAVVESLYGTAERELNVNAEVVENSDSLTIRSVVPSLYDTTKRPIKPVNEPNEDSAGDAVASS